MFFFYGVISTTKSTGLNITHVSTGKSPSEDKERILSAQSDGEVIAEHTSFSLALFVVVFLHLILSLLLLLCNFFQFSTLKKMVLVVFLIGNTGFLAAFIKAIVSV